MEATTATEDQSAINGTSSPDAYPDWGLPPGWTYEGVLYVVMLLRMRIVICYIAVVCNVIVLLLQIKLQSFRKTHFMFGLLLTISDIVYTAAVLIETYHYYLNKQPVPIVYSALVLAANLLGFFAIIGVGFDRYLALCAIPLKYRIVVTTKKYALIIMILVIFSSLYSFIFTRYFPLGSAIIPIRSFSVLLFMVTLSSSIYIMLGISIRRSMKKMMALSEASMQKSRIQQTKRLMFAFSLILVTNAVCYLPQSFFNFWLVLQPIDMGFFLLKNTITANWLYNIRTLNSICNPVIYWFQVLMRELSLPCRKLKKSLSTATSRRTDLGSVTGSTTNSTTTSFIKR